MVIASIAIDQLRRRPGGGVQGRDREHLQPAGRAGIDGHRAAPHRHDLHGALLRRGRARLPDRGAGDGDGARRAAARKLRIGFAHTLIPIAFAYLVAHYFSLFVFQEQAQFTYLLSDPLGTATTDLFGTASAGIDFGVLSANAIWYVQVGALVVGHVIGLTLAHDRAIAYWGDYRQAARSQYWMLAVMVAFTCFGLYLLSVANG